MVRKLFVAAILGLGTLAFSTQSYAQQDLIEKRQAAMKQQSADAKAIKAAVEAKDYATIETKAKDIMGISEKIPELFPKGSTKGKTKATNTIWEKNDEFVKDAKNLTRAARELADAAKAKDDSAVAAKVKAVSGACSECHKTFRADKYSE